MFPEVDERLRRAGAALGDRVDPSGVFERISERTAPRSGVKGRVRAVVLFVVVVGAVAAGSYGVVRAFLSSGVTLGHRPISSPGVIPWASVTPPPSPAPTVTTPSSAPPCTDAMLKARSSAFEGATGSKAGGIWFTNVGASSCSLRGTPRVEILDRAGQVLPVTQQPGRSAPSVVVGPGHKAVVAVQWFNWCAPWPSDPRFTFRITLQGGRGLLMAPFGSLRPRCDSASSGSTVNIGAFQSMDVPSGSAPPPPPLSAKLYLPASVVAGTTLHYEVTITNTSSTPFRFAGCPSYREEIGPAGGGGRGTQGEFVLNCGPAGVLAPGAGVTFAMQLALPVDAELGRAGFFWLLEPGFATLPGPPVPGSGPAVKGDLLVTGG